MDEIFINLLNMSISAGWVILAVCLLRFLLKKAPKAIRCCLWILVGIRLVCPISPESALSLIPSAEPIPQEILYNTNPAIESGIETVNNVVNPILSSSFAPDPGDSVNPIQVFLHTASLLWITGTLAMLLYALVSCIRLARRVAVSVRLEGNLWLCDNVSSPFIFGILFPRVYLPSLLEETQLACVVAHEKAHLKRHDHWWKPLGFLLLSVYWFNPLCWAAYILLCRDIELACDERVIKSMKAEEKKKYAETLLSCGTPGPRISACPLAFGEVSVKERIRTVLNYKKPSFWIAAVSILAFGGAALAFLTSPASSLKDIFGAGYRVKEVLYDAPRYDFTYTPANAPEYVFTEDFDLMERCPEDPSGNAGWNLIGNFGLVEYSQTDLLSLFVQERDAGSAQVFSLSDTAKKKLGKAEKIWRADTLDKNGRFLLAIQTGDGEVILATGYDTEGASHIRWLWEMERSSPRFSQEYLSDLISSMSGSDANIFAVYESATLPGKLIAGFRAKNGNKPGFAVFNCKDPQNSYGYTLKGIHTHHRDSIIHITIGEDWGFDHSVTIVLNEIRNLSRLQVRAGTMLQETSPGSVVPSMIVFEWPGLLSEEEAADVELFYDTTDAAYDEKPSAETREESSDNSSLTPAFDEHALLDKAISAAILEHCARVSSHESQQPDDSLFRCQSHRLLAPAQDTVRRTSDLSFLTGSAGITHEIIVYVMAMYQVCRLSPEGIREIETLYFPAKLTFSLAGDQDYEPGKTPVTENIYILKEFWKPEESYTGTGRETYEAGLRETFPADMAEEALRALTSQKEIDAHKQACYAQAVTYGNLDTDPIIRELFDTILSASSGVSSNPYTYLTACPEEHFALHYYGEYTLRYIEGELQKGSQTGLKEQLMKIIREELTNQKNS